MFKKAKKVIIISSLFSLMFCMSIKKVQAYASSVYLGSVSRVVQAQSNWCWAACDQMVARYDSSSSKTQYDIVYHEFGNYSNSDASISATLDGVKYGSDYSFNYYSTSAFSYVQIENQLDNVGSPLIASISNGVNGHAVVVHGYDSADTSVDYIDPKNGVSYNQDFIDFQNGVGILSYGTYRNTIYHN